MTDFKNKIAIKKYTNLKKEIKVQNRKLEMNQSVDPPYQSCTYSQVFCI